MTFNIEDASRDTNKRPCIGSFDRERHPGQDMLNETGSAYSTTDGVSGATNGAASGAFGTPGPTAPTTNTFSPHPTLYPNLSWTRVCPGSCPRDCPGAHPRICPRPEFAPKLAPEITPELAPELAPELPPEFVPDQNLHPNLPQS